jgi:murein DD-endopeptidase MepM/ murein hydrolase activator NlpD
MYMKAGYVFWLIPLAGVGLFLWWGLSALDLEDPVLKSPEGLAVLGRRTTFVLKAADASSGLREVRVTLTQGGLEKVLLTQTFPPGGEAGQEAEISVTVAPAELGFAEGPATLTATARDRSWRGFFQGRTATWSRGVVIDLVPVHLSLEGVNHLLHFGGTGVMRYRLNKEVAESGVRVNGRLSPGYPLPQGEKGEYVAFFPIPLEPPVPFAVELVARTAVGEVVKRPVPLNLKPRKWRHDNMNLSESFLRQVATTFQVQHPDPLQAFLTVNREMRRANHEKLKELCRHSRPEPLWSGAFQRYLGKPMARFGDKRTYLYQGKAVDHQTHLGEDLASLERSPVPATAAGVVVLAEPLGIYGNTVVLDHGLGIFSMYSHLSRMEVQRGERVEKGARLGLTGTTGLAGGDHLHYSVLVHGEFVDPLEWWDPKWHRDQVQGMMAVKAAAPAAAPPERRKATPRPKKRGR